MRIPSFNPLNLIRWGGQPSGAASSHQPSQASDSIGSSAPMPSHSRPFFRAKCAKVFMVIFAPFRFVFRIVKKALSWLCCGCFSSRVSDSTLYRESVDSFRELSHEFKKQADVENEANLKAWWLGKFNSFDQRIQELFLIEYIITRAPPGQQDKRAWAEENKDLYKANAIGFAVELKRERLLKLYFRDPKQDVPQLLDNLHATLIEKIRLQEDQNLA